MIASKAKVVCSISKKSELDSDETSEEIKKTDGYAQVRLKIPNEAKRIPINLMQYPNMLGLRNLKGLKVIIPRQKYRRRKSILMDWKKYHKLNVIYSYMDELERNFPAICTVTVIGRSVEGRAIKMLTISNSSAGNSAAWLDGSIHSREWITTSVVTYLADVIVKNFYNLSNSLQNTDWYIVPVLNPDGYEYTHTRDRMWRKNRARHEGECVGVDLNRNFSYGWGNNGEEGSSKEPSNVFYRGSAPFSEPETVAVRDTILGSTSTFKVFLSFHSYYELIIFPWGFKSDPCPDYLNLLEGGVVMSRVTCSRDL